MPEPHNPRHMRVEDMAMSTIVKLRCPNCSTMLKIPTDWLEQAMRCKHCGQVLRTRKKSPTSEALPASVPTPPDAELADMPPATASPPLPAGFGAPPQPASPFAFAEAPPAALGPTPPLSPVAPAFPGYAPPAPVAGPMPAPALPGYPPQPPGYAGYPPQPPGYAGYPPQPPGYAAYPPQFNVPTLPPALPPTLPPTLPASPPPSANAAGPAPIIAASRKVRRSKLPLVIGGLVFMALLSLGLLILPSLLKSPTKTPDVAKDDSGNKQTPAATAGGVMPRRLLAITVSNYIYANPINYGNEQRGIRSLIRVLHRAWRIPDDQVYELSDNAPDGKGKPPLKRSIEKAVDDFLTTSRAQDRVVLLIVGHIVERDGTAYLVPLEGDLEDPATLVKFSGDEGILTKLAACKAQQKLLIVDTCRYDPGRGEERPGSGPMGEELDKILSEPPPGVQILSSCSKGEYSYEFDNGLVYNNRPIQGSVFVNLFVNGSTQVTLGIQTPKTAIPVEPYAKKLAEVFRSPDPNAQLKQTPRLAGLAPPKEGLYDPKEPPAPPIVLGATELSLPGGVAPPEEIRKLLAEIDVPPIKLARRDSFPPKLETIIPFSAEKMKDYAPDYRTPEELLKSAEKRPLRRAVLDAMNVFKEIRESLDKNELPEVFVGTASDAVKKDIADKQRTPAILLVKLEALLDELEETAEKEMENEPSKRWRAHFDYIRAQVIARYMYTSEYNYMLANIRTDRLPDLDEKAGHKGWRLAARADFSNRDAKKLKNQWTELLDKLIAENPGTPWEVLARRDRTMALGLAWEPSANVD